MSQARYQKRMREKAKQEKAAAKRERRAERAEAASAEAASAAVGEQVVEHDAASQQDVIARLAALHADFEDSRIDFEDFEQQKLQLMAQLSVD